MLLCLCLADLHSIIQSKILDFEMHCFQGSRENQERNGEGELMNVGCPVGRKIGQLFYSCYLL